MISELFESINILSLWCKDVLLLFAYEARQG